MKYLKISLVLLAILPFALNAQDSYTLDSVAVAAQNIETQHTQNIAAQATKSGGGKKFFQAVRTLFGVGVEGIYSYENGDYQFDKILNKDLELTQNGHSVSHSFSNIPEHYQFNDGNLKVKLHTPVIILEQTWNFNYFSNDLTKGRKYESTHINSLGLMRLGMFLDDVTKTHKYSGIGMLGSLFLPVWDRQKIRSENYDLDYSRTGWFYSLFGPVKQHEVIRNAVFKSNNQEYNNVTIDINRKGWDWNMSQFFVFFRDILLFTSELAVSRGGNFNDFDAKESNKRLTNFIPIPIINSVVKGNMSVKDENGNLLFDGSANNSLGSFVELGLNYQGYFVFPKIHGVLVPSAQWIYPMNFNVGIGFMVCI
ncbi:hypothetical protein FACS189413_06800 [Bacteroidia bacterium]|nr:hypothetical protein FACS189413_06800 [Bacteroidia bacterium]